MLEHRRALLAVQVGGVGARQAGVEGLFDRQGEISAFIAAVRFPCLDGVNFTASVVIVCNR